MLQDAFRATSRDGASDVEAMMWIQKELGVLMMHADASWATALKSQAKDSFAWAERALELEENRREVEALHSEAPSATNISQDAAPASALPCPPFPSDPADACPTEKTAQIL